MAIAYTEWDIAISSRLSPVREELRKANINVAAIPKEAGKLGVDEFESVDWLFPQMEGLPREHRGKQQPVRAVLVVRLTFDQRYVSDGDTHKAALEWAETEIIELLIGYRLPKAREDITLDNVRLFAPEAGRWFKELRFIFEVIAEGKDEPGKLPDALVKTIEIKNCENNQIIEVVNG